MAASWKKIFKTILPNGSLVVTGIRTNTNNLGTFKSSVVIQISDNMEEEVDAYTTSQLQTFVENNCDVDGLDEGLNPSSLPTDQ